MTKPGSAPARPGTGAAKPSTGTAKPGSAATQRPGAGTTKTGEAGARAAGTAGQDTDRAAARDDRQAGREQGRTDRQDQRDETRQERQGDREEAREDWQEHLEDQQEDRQDFIRDQEDDWDHHHHDDWDDDDDDWAVPLALVGGVLLGAMIANIPDDSETVYAQGQPYYYSNGNYYQPAPSGSGYQAVAAPTGAAVQELPPQTVNVNVEGDKNYYYSNGAFYEESAAQGEAENPEYTVVAPPMGAMVPDLPDGTEKRSVNDATYFVYGDTWYKPFYSGDEVVYKVVEAPVPADAPPADAPPPEEPPAG
jgi:hypothetical protein